MKTTSRLVYVLLGPALIGVGVFAVVHPEFARGVSLILLGLAVLERGSGRLQRLLAWISDKLAGPAPRLRRRGRRIKPARALWGRPRRYGPPYSPARR